MAVGKGRSRRYLSRVTQLSLSDVSIEYGSTTILTGVTFTVAAGERWGIVGRNGSGKTSLFKAITGNVKPSKGAVARDPGLRVSLLDQHRDFGNAKTVCDAAAMPWVELIDLERSLGEQAHAMASYGNDVPMAVLDKYGHDMERFAHLGGYTFHARVDAVLQGLGFDADAYLGGRRCWRAETEVSRAGESERILLFDRSWHG